MADCTFFLIVLMFLLCLLCYYSFSISESYIWYVNYYYIQHALKQQLMQSFNSPRNNYIRWIKYNPVCRRFATPHESRYIFNYIHSNSDKLFINCSFLAILSFYNYFIFYTYILLVSLHSKHSENINGKSSLLFLIYN